MKLEGLTSMRYGSVSKSLDDDDFDSETISDFQEAIEKCRQDHDAVEWVESNEERWRFTYSEKTECVQVHLYLPKQSYEVKDASKPKQLGDFE